MRSTSLPRSLLVVLLCVLLTPVARGTWSIVVVNTVTREVGVGCATCITNFDLSRYIPALRPGLGVGVVQSSGDVGGIRKPVIWAGLGAHKTPREIMEDVSNLPWFQNTQIGIVSFDGPPSTFSGTGAGAAVCQLTGQVGDLWYAIQGNVMTGEVVCDAAESALVNTDGDLVTRLLASMEAARAMGGDGRCSCVRPNAYDCGAPPPSFTKSAHSGFVIVTRMGDVEGDCDKTSGCAQGDYYFNKSVAGAASDPDPVLTLIELEAKWRKKQRKRPDHFFSEVLVDRQRLVADGKSSAWVELVLRNIEGDPLDAGGALITVQSTSTGSPIADVGAATDNGDGTYSLELTATSAAGAESWQVIVDDGGPGPARLLETTIELASDPLADLHVGVADQSASAPLSIPFTFNRGPSEAGRPYWLLGGLSGTSPGLDIGGVHLPLNRDRFFHWTWTAAGNSQLPDSVGSLDADGRATPWLILPEAAWSQLVGERLDFCALLGSPFQEATTGVSLVVHP